MKNYWLENNVVPKVDFSCPLYLQWLKEIWHVEIKEQARHLWPGQYTISGWWQDEKDLYNKYEKEWDKRRQEVWDKKWGAWKKQSLQELADGSATLMGGEDYFHWNVETPSWSLHKDGTWNKMLVKDWLTRGERITYPGIYTYEQACITLGQNHNLPQKFEGYDKHLNDVVENYDYTR